MGDLSDIERLRKTCEEAEDWYEWHDGILGLLQYVRESTREERESEKFHRLIWDEDLISRVKPGGDINVEQAIRHKELRSWLAEQSLRDLPNDGQERAEALTEIREDLLERVRAISMVGSKQPKAKTTRLLAALFPKDFTTLVSDRVLEEFIRKFNDFFPTIKIENQGSVPSKHRQILDKLDEALGPVPDGDLGALTRRMTLPWLLKEKKKDEPTEPEATDDSDENPSQAPEETAAPQNIILYGPPGTGKTYATFRRCVEICYGKKEAEAMSDEDVRRRYRKLVAEERVEFVTFHQSYGYEEFVEGLRPVLNEVKGNNQVKGSDVAYEIHDGVFKRISLRAAAGGLPKPAGEQDFDDTVRWVQKVLDQSDSDDASFSFSDKTPQYVLIIDEINRGNVSKILGELITLLEPDKRLGADNELTLPLSYSPSHRFGVPPNLHILGTMNTADRSIALMDVALRRRFTFEECMPDEEVIRKVLESRLTNNEPLINLVVDLFKIINERIRFLYDRDHQLGHSYFLEVNNLEDLRRVFADRVIPLLQEYFYGDWDKICTVLGCPYDENGKKRRGNDHPIVKASKFGEGDTLGFDHDEYEDKVDFHIKPKFQSGGMLDRDLAWTFLAWTFLSVLQIDSEAKSRRFEELTGSGAEAGQDETDDDS